MRKLENRRIPNGTYGGVRGRRATARLLLDGLCMCPYGALSFEPCALSWTAAFAANAPPQSPLATAYPTGKRLTTICASLRSFKSCSLPPRRGSQGFSLRRSRGTSILKPQLSTLSFVPTSQSHRASPGCRPCPGRRCSPAPPALWRPFYCGPRSGSIR